MYIKWPTWRWSKLYSTDKAPSNYRLNRSHPAKTCVRISSFEVTIKKIFDLIGSKLTEPLALLFSYGMVHCCLVEQSLIEIGPGELSRVSCSNLYEQFLFNVIFQWIYHWIICYIVVLRVFILGLFLIKVTEKFLLGIITVGMFQSNIAGFLIVVLYPTIAIVLFEDDLINQN